LPFGLAAAGDSSSFVASRDRVMSQRALIGDTAVMRFSLIRLLALLFVVPLASCGKMKLSLGKLAALKKGAAAATAEASPSPGTTVSDIDKNTYPSFIAKKDALVIVDFHAGWCPPCKQMGPALEKAVASHAGIAFLGKVDIDRAKVLAAENGVRSIPDVRIFKNGAQVDRIVGFPGEAVILARIDKLCTGMKPAAAGVASVPTADATPPEPKIRPAEKGWMPLGLTRKGTPVPVPTASAGK
jgi:thioredoxin 1